MRGNLIEKGELEKSIGFPLDRPMRLLPFTQLLWKKIHQGNSSGNSEMPVMVIPR